MNILIADDDPNTIDMLTNTLEAFGYNVTAATDGNEACALLRTGNYRIFISDWQMPGKTGVQLCQEIRERGFDSYIYVILLTSFSSMEGVVQGLESGADDFLTKPFNPAELIVRIRAGERIINLESREMTIFSLAKLAESRDKETGDHLERIRTYVKILAEELSKQVEFHDIIDGEYIKLLYLTSPLHDIGKVAIPDCVLLKPGRLTAEEFEVMKTHTTLGAQTLADVTNCYPSAGYLKMAVDIALTHHEKFDGKGYPHGLAGDNIPLCGRITAIADVYDALTSARVYKDAFTHETALEIITRDSGTHFDPRIVQAFLHCQDKFLEVKNTLNYEPNAVALT